MQCSSSVYRVTYYIIAWNHHLLHPCGHSSKTHSNVILYTSDHNIRTVDPEIPGSSPKLVSIFYEAIFCKLSSSLCIVNSLQKHTKISNHPLPNLIFFPRNFQIFDRDRRLLEFLFNRNLSYFQLTSEDGMEPSVRRNNSRRGSASLRWSVCL